MDFWGVKVFLLVDNGIIPYALARDLAASLNGQPSHCRFQIIE